MTTTFITGAILALPLIIGFVGIALFSAKKQKNNKLLKGSMDNISLWGFVVVIQILLLFKKLTINFYKLIIFTYKQND